MSKVISLHRAGLSRLVRVIGADFLSETAVVDVLQRLELGEWGNVNDEELRQNAANIRNGGRLVAHYVVRGSPWTVVVEGNTAEFRLRADVEN